MEPEREDADRLASRAARARAAADRMLLPPVLTSEEWKLGVQYGHLSVEPGGANPHVRGRLSIYLMDQCTESREDGDDTYSDVGTAVDPQGIPAIVALLNDALPVDARYKLTPLHVRALRWLLEQTDSYAFCFTSETELLWDAADELAAILAALIKPEPEGLDEGHGT